jgi:membrane protein DedA with SNARE-associated domain
VAPSGELPGFLESVAPLLDRFGYLAVAGVIGVESFGVPAPGQTIMIAAAVYAGAGRLNIFAVAIVAFLAAVIGDNVGYLIGRRGGRKVVTKYGKYIFITPARFDRAEQFFNRRGPRIIVAARFIDGLRQLNGVIAGITAMRWQSFLLYNAIGAVLWVGLWTTLAYVAGSHISVVGDFIHQYHWFAYAAVALGIGGWVAIHLRRRRAARLADTASVEPH